MMKNVQASIFCFYIFRSETNDVQLLFYRTFLQTLL